MCSGPAVHPALLSLSWMGNRLVFQRVLPRAAQPIPVSSTRLTLSWDEIQTLSQLPWLLPLLWLCCLFLPVLQTHRAFWAPRSSKRRVFLLGDSFLHASHRSLPVISKATS